jgi:FlaA1/EpsC-like NDP-sugar epimerase
VALGAVAIPVVLVMLRLTAVVPRSVLILYPLILIILMAGSRFAYRIWKEHRLYSPLAALGEPVLILGAGEAGARLTNELAHSRQWRVVGLLDDDPGKQGRLLRNISVLGPIAELPLWVKRFGVRTVIIALPAAAHGVRRRVAELCAAAGVEALTVPSYDDLISGRSQLTTIRHVELDDILARDPVVLDSAGLSDWIGGRVVMVTGAGGSIGAELCRQIARFRPLRLVLFDLSEYALYQIQQALQDEFPGLPLATLVGDVKHRSLVEQVLTRERPSVIFHAAAYKHVPLMEETNAWQAVRNNAYGTWTLARAAAAARVEKFVLVSTDKAVNPTNVMGASKRLAEMVCQSLQNGTTQFVIVRFGNVFGSAGSVIPRFREQIARGGPVTVTHPEITRYFMSSSEATQILLQAGLMGRGGEVLVLDMGEPVKIVDLARDMIRLSGGDPDKIRVVFTGLRPGEKLYEEPLASGETRHFPDTAKPSSRWSAGSSATVPPATPRSARGSRRGFRNTRCRARCRSDWPVLCRCSHGAAADRCAFDQARLCVHDAQIDDRGVALRQIDRFHAARTRTLGDSAATAAHPRDLALEQHSLIAAGERIDGHRAKRRVAPEKSGAADRRRARTEQRDRRDRDDASEMRDAGIGRDQQRGVGEQSPQLR